MQNLYKRRLLRKEGSEQSEREQKWRDWEKDESGSRGLAKKIWMGEEKEGWKERRMREERRNVEQGKGVADVIVEQVKEVWGVPKEEDEEGEEKK